MRWVIILLALIFAVGCSNDDERLHGTWRSNREATVAEVFRADSAWASASLERRAKFAEMFGKMRVTFSGGIITSVLGGRTYFIGYRVVSRGRDYVVIHYDRGLDARTDIRIRFVDGGSAYWISGGGISLGMQERFDRVIDSSTK